MAIQKDKLLESGAAGNYWKIIYTALNKITMRLDVQIALFTNQKYSVAGIDLGLIKEFSFELTKEAASGDLIAFGYVNIKLQKDPDLVDGVDV